VLAARQLRKSWAIFRHAYAAAEPDQIAACNILNAYLMVPDELIIYFLVQGGCTFDRSLAHVVRRHRSCGFAQGGYEHDEIVTYGNDGLCGNGAGWAHFRLREAPGT
jgi:hypothetical protein